MNIYSLLPLIAAIAYIPLLVITSMNRPIRRQNIIFILFIVAGMLFSIFSFLQRSDYLPEYKLIIFKLSFCSFLWMVVQFFYFIRFYLYKSAGWGTYLGYSLLISIIIGAVLGYVPQSFSSIQGIVTVRLGYWLIPTLLIPLILAVTSMYYLIYRFRSSSDPMERNRISYLFLAVGLLCVFGIINTTRVGDYFPTAQIGQAANAALLTYATLRFRIIDINLIMRRSLVYGAMIMLCLIIFSAWLIFFNSVFKLEINFGAAIFAALLTGISISFFWTRISGFLYNKIDTLVYGENYNHRLNLSDYVRHGITRVFSLEELCNQLLPILVRVLDCRNAYLLLPEIANSDFIAKYIYPFKKLDTSFIIRKESPISRWLIRENRYLNVTAIDTTSEFQSMWGNEREQIKNLDIELFFPLISRDNLVGILALSRKTMGKYMLDETNLIEEISSQIAISVEKEYIQNELRRSEQELSLINRLSAVITSSLNISEVYDAFVEGLREVVDVNFTAVNIVEGKDLILTALYTETGWAWKVGDKIPLKNTATEWVIKHGKSFFEPDLDKDRMFITGEEYLRRGIKSVVYLPLITKGEAIGSLTIASKKINAYSPSQIQLLERLALQISTSVANSLLYSRAEKRARVDELTQLFNRRHFDESINLEISRHSRYGSILSTAFIDLDNFKNYNDINGHMAGDKLLTKIGRLIKESLRSIDLAFRYGGDEFAVIMPHTPAEDAFNVAERLRVRITNATRSENILVTASIGLASWPSDGLTFDDIINAADKALYYAKQTGGNRTCLVSQMLPRAGAEQIESLPTAEKETLNTIYALSATIEARDPYTYGHSRKVRAYAVALAESLGLSSDKVAAISHAALLHDIGKIGVIDEILKKKGKLEPCEMESIKTHPLLSKTIVGHVSSLTPCLPAILHHHERWDGSGYPAGLKGETIPLEARIISIADAFDAMTSLRPYRAPLTYKEAIAELKRCAGTQFDPNLVKKFIPVALTINPQDFEILEKPDLEKQARQL